ncbi:MAG: glycosyltransferase family 1 protein, partial [Gemmatimonadaceae bacterium]
MPPSRLRILTWHVHGNYLYYLSQVPHEWYVVSKPGRPAGYSGRSGTLPWGPNVHDMPVSDLDLADFDCILFQSQAHYTTDQHELLGPRHRHIPRVYLEHDPPREHPTDTRHVVQDARVHVVHVTHYNALMWDNGEAPTHVVEHGVVVPKGVRYSGERAEGIAVVNNLRQRGRRLGLDVYRRLRAEVPLALIGMDSEVEGGLGEVRNVDVPAFISRYRFYFHPCRYTSWGLAACEAMMIGMPVVAPATTEIVTVILSG